MDDSYRAGIGHPGLLALYDYWFELKAGRPEPPQRTAFDPLRMGAALPTLIINEVVHGAAPDGGPRFRIRLEGDDVVQARGFSSKGRFIDEPGVLLLKKESTIAEYVQVVATGVPSYRQGRFKHAEGRFGKLYRLAVPFAGPEHPARVDFLYVCFRHEI